MARDGGDARGEGLRAGRRGARGERGERAVIDIGANLTNKAFRRDLDGVLTRAKDAGVHAIVMTGTSAAASRAAWEIAEASRNGPRLYATAGVHPHQASTWSRGTEQEIRALAARREVLAIGE